MRHEATCLWCPGQRDQSGPSCILWNAYHEILLVNVVWLRAEMTCVRDQGPAKCLVLALCVLRVVSASACLCSSVVGGWGVYLCSVSVFVGPWVCAPAFVCSVVSDCVCFFPSEVHGSSGAAGSAMAGTRGTQQRRVNSNTEKREANKKQRDKSQSCTEPKRNRYRDKNHKQKQRELNPHTQRQNATHKGKCTRPRAHEH